MPTEELVRRSGARAFTAMDELAPATDPLGGDGEYEEFLADLYPSRRSGAA